MRLQVGIALVIRLIRLIIAHCCRWEAHSYGYHGDDGHAFSGSGHGRAYGPPFGAGDVVGALLNRADRTIRWAVGRLGGWMVGRLGGWGRAGRRGRGAAQPRGQDDQVGGWEVGWLDGRAVGRLGQGRATWSGRCSTGRTGRSGGRLGGWVAGWSGGWEVEASGGGRRMGGWAVRLLGSRRVGVGAWWRARSFY